MSRLVWDQVGQKLYETGTSQGVLYPIDNAGVYSTGYPWNGLIGVTESPEGAEPNDQYADDIKYLSLLSAETLGGTVEAFTYPDEFAECDGSAELSPGVMIGQQNRKVFGLSYKTIVGNDIDNDDYGYKIHLYYGCKASPSEKAYQTKSDSPEAITLSWELSTTPVPVTGHKPTASVTLDSTKIPAAGMKAIEDVLYGTEEAEPRLPLPDEVNQIIETAVSAGA